MSPLPVILNQIHFSFLDPVSAWKKEKVSSTKNMLELRWKTYILANLALKFEKKEQYI